MTGKLHQAERSLALLDAAGTANRLMGSVDGTTMAMQRANAAILAQGVANRAATRVVATSNVTWPSSAAEQAAADYLCDGTADEVEINAALASLPASGGKVLLANGQYTLAGPITLGGARRILQGSGMGVTTLQVPSAAGTPVNTTLIAVNNDYCELLDLTIDGNRANNAAQTSMTLVTVSGTNAPLVQRVRMINSGQYGLVVLGNVANGVVRDCLIENSGFRGAVLRAAANQPLVVSGCTFKTSVSYGVWMDSGPVTLSDCQALSNSSYGFDIDSASQVTMTQCFAQSNAAAGYQIEGSNTRAVLVQCRSVSNGASGFRTDGVQTMFMGCTSTTTTGSANGFLTAGTDALLVGCMSSDQGTGFSHANTGRVSYIGCRSINNTGRGFDLTNGAAQLQGCHVLGGPGSSYGIVMAGAGGNHMVDGCRIMNCGADGINIGASIVNVQLTNNFLTSSGLATNNTYKHMAIAGDQIFIDQNVLRDPPSGNRPSYGIYLDSQCDNCFIGHNDAAGAGINGQIQDGSTTTRRISRLALDYTASTDLYGGAIAAATWTDIVPNQTFTVFSRESVVEIAVRASILVGSGTLASVALIRMVLDGTTNKNLSGEIAETTTGYQNVMAGMQPIQFQNLTVGSHTVKLQINAILAANAYLRCATAAVQEFMSIQVTEYAR